MKCLPRLAAALSACTIATPARAADVRVTNTAIAEAHAFNRNGRRDDDDYSMIVNRLNLNGTDGALSAHLRIDSATFIDREARLNPGLRDDLRAERFALDYQLGDLRITAGDFYRQLGRGILLALRKEDEIGVDVGIRGGQLRYSSATQEASLFGGVINPANLDAVSLLHTADTEDAMAGGHYELRALDGFTIGTHGLLLYPHQSILASVQDLSVSGGLYANIAGLADWLALYGEADVQYRQLAGEEQRGLATYVTADAHFGDTGVLVEGIFLDAFETLGSKNRAVGQRFAYNRPPTLQRIREEVLDSTDVTGARLRIEHYIAAADLVLFVNGLVRFTGPSRDSRQLHAWGGGELGYAGGSAHLNATSGYRDESSQGSHVKSLAHIEVDWLQPIAGGFAVHVVTDTEARTLVDTDYVRGSTFFGIERAGVGSVTFELGYDTQDPSPNINNYFFAGIVGVDLSDAVAGTITAGTQRGGLECVAGVCREYPAFAGLRVEIVARL